MPRGEHLKKYIWKKGQSGNPKGRPKLSDEEKSKREKEKTDEKERLRQEKLTEKRKKKLTHQTFDDIVNKYIFMTGADIDKLWADPPPDMTVIEVLFIGILVRAMKTANVGVTEFILGWTIGKPREQAEEPKKRPKITESNVLSIMKRLKTISDDKVKAK